MDLSIANLLSTYELPVIFLGSFFFGETVILAAAFLAGEGTWSLGTVFWLSLLGTVISDSLWFFLGQFFFQLTKRWEKYQSKYQSFLLKLEEWTGQEPFFALLFIKFLYGTRILTIIYLSARKVPFGTFFFFNLIGTVIWLTVMISVGWLVGKGVGGVDTALLRIQYAVTSLALLIIFYKIATAWLGRKITKK